MKALKVSLINSHDTHKVNHLIKWINDERKITRSTPSQDTPFLRVLHIIVAVLVLLQIINSNLTEREALADLSLTAS
jgi:hypothetical protein